MATEYVAEPILKIDGKAASAELLEDILQILVEESLHLPGMFTLVIKNDYYGGDENHKVWQHEKLFAIGKSIEIGFSASTTESDEFDEENKGTVIKGEITAIESHFTSEAQAPIIIRGYDVAHRLHRGRYSRSFQKMTDTAIVKKIVGEVGITCGTVDTTSPTHEYVFQQNQTNMEFLRERATRNGYELFVQDGKLNFRKPSKGNKLTLEWLKDLHSFRVRVSSAEQVKSVEVRGWDYLQKKAIVGTATAATINTATEYGIGSKTSSSFSGKPTAPKLVVVDQPVASATEAKALATALFTEVGGEFVHADARSEGNPDIRPGCMVKLSGMGKYSGDYYVTETRHIFHERIYLTEFSVRGLRANDLVQALSTQPSLQPSQTFLIGQVSNNNDPQKLGRVRVKFPTLTEEHESDWARVVSVGAGSSRGLDWLPEIGDEVLVAFEHGNIHRPYIIGGLWNGKDKPPETTENTVVSSKVRLRTLKTRTGHELQFVEEDKDASKKGVYLQTVYGHKLQLNDSEQSTQLTTKEGHSLVLDDKNKKVELKTSGGHKVLSMTLGRR
jgi:phage protein D